MVARFARRRPAFPGVLGTAVLLHLAGASTAQSIETHGAAGVRFPRPNGFQGIPVPPVQTGVVLRYVEKPSPGRKGVVFSRKEVVFVELGRDGERAERWLSRAGYGASADGDFDTSRHGARLRRQSGPSGVAWWVSSDGRNLAVLGRLLDPSADFDGWAYAMKELRLMRPKEQDLDRLAGSHRKRGLSEPDYRARVQSSLLRGWKYENTPNFIIVYNTGNEPFIRAIASELEVMREEYARLFPPRESLERVSTVRICHDASEYLAYGGPPGSGGFWSAAIRELVLFDNARRDGISDWTNEDTRRVLYHEAFHQYVHDAIGSFDPHMWFNEGIGDYFSGARVKKGAVTTCEPVDERLALMQSLLDEDPSAYIPWDVFLLMDRDAFYQKSRVQLCYAQAWSMVYFLMTSPDVEQRGEWREILPTYFDALKDVYAALRSELTGGDRTASEEALRKARARARTRAHTAAFEHVDLDELEAAWRDFVLEL